MNKYDSLYLKRISKIIFIFLIMGIYSLNCKAATYTEGYFEYTDDGGSVTITGYFGSDETVTVPNMIAGEPVSKIAKGAFPDGCSVKNLNLPDTVVTIEEGAISQSISVTFNSNTTQPSDAQEEISNTNPIASEELTTESTTIEVITPDNTEASNPQNNNSDIAEGGYEEVEPITSNTNTPGIILPNNKGVLTVDNNGYLVIINSDNKTVVIDDTQSYKLEEKESSYVITSEDGTAVKVSDTGDITYKDKSGKELIKSSNGKSASKLSKNKLFIIIVVIILAIMLLGIIIWIQKNHSEESADSKKKDNLEKKED